jgi:hypothetical protein
MKFVSRDFCLDSTHADGGLAAVNGTLTLVTSPLPFFNDSHYQHSQDSSHISRYLPYHLVSKNSRQDRADQSLRFMVLKRTCNSDKLSHSLSSYAIVAMHAGMKRRSLISRGTRRS